MDDAVKFAQRTDSGISLSTEEAPPVKPHLPLQVSQLLSGLDIILDYLNHGNSLAEVKKVRFHAFQWCSEYYGNVFYVSGSGKVIKDAHPRFFCLDTASILRLDSPISNREDKDDNNDEVMIDDGHGSDAGEQMDQDNPFPEYAEPVLVDDQDLYRALELYDAEAAKTSAQHESDSNLGLSFNLEISAMDLRDSPVLFYMPEVLCQLSMISIVDLFMKEARQTTSAVAALAAKEIAAQPAMDIDQDGDGEEDNYQVMSDCQASKSKSPWSLLPSIIRA